MTNRTIGLSYGATRSWEELKNGVNRAITVSRDALVEGNREQALTDLELAQSYLDSLKELVRGIKPQENGSNE